MINKVLAKYPYLVLKKGFDMDTISIDAAKTGLELSRDDKKYIINKIYEMLFDAKGYASVEVKGTMLVLKKY